MKSALIRAARTFVQAFLGALLTSGVLQAVVDTSSIDLSALQSAAISAAAAGVIALMSFVQNLLEEAGLNLGNRG